MLHVTLRISVPCNLLARCPRDVFSFGSLAPHPSLCLLQRVGCHGLTNQRHTHTHTGPRPRAGRVPPTIKQQLDQQGPLSATPVHLRVRVSASIVAILFRSAHAHAPTVCRGSQACQDGAAAARARAVAGGHEAARQGHTDSPRPGGSGGNRAQPRR